MRHVILTCKNHLELRWSCKEIAFDDDHGYNGRRNIRYCGTPLYVDGVPQMHGDLSGLQCSYTVAECDCPVTCLVRAPEDQLVARTG